MIVCPKCKAEIDADSCYCDQCGQEIRYCHACGKPGKGNRCTACGGRMVSANERMNGTGGMPNGYPPVATASNGTMTLVSPSQRGSAATDPRLQLTNTSLGLFIEGQNGGILGRRQGIYAPMLGRFPYVSGTHAQLHFEAEKGRWTLTDLNSSNGTKYNGTSLTPGIPCLLEQGGIVQLANVVLTVKLIHGTP